MEEMNLREIDKLVAIRVMGWVFYAHAGWYKPGDYEINSSWKQAETMWSPTGEIKAAWQVIEKLREMPFSNIVWKLVEDLAERFDANQDDYCADVFNLMMNLDPLSICLSALVAYGVNTSHLTLRRADTARP